MPEYGWTFGPFTVIPESDGLKNVVTEIAYSFWATDGKKTETIAGALHLGAPDPETFTALEDITEEQTVEWARALVDVPAYEAALCERLAPTPPTKTVKVAPPFAGKEKALSAIAMAVSPLNA